VSWQAYQYIVLRRRAGSPFTIPVIDGSRATANGEGLGSQIVANKPTSFFVNTKAIHGDAELDVTITCKSPR
jgi:hypothetical protein